MRRPANLLVGAALVLGGAAGCAAGETRLESGPRPRQMPAAGLAQAMATAFPGIYPFTSAAELDAYAAGSDQTFRDPVRTAREFVTQYLGFTAPDVTLSDFRTEPGRGGAGEVAVSTRRGDQTFLRTNVALRQLGPTGPGGPWTVVGATSPDIVVDRPQPLDQVSSPVAVSGRGRGFEGTISLEIREDGMVFGQRLGQGFAMGGSTEVLPFSGSLSFRAPTRAGGAVLFQDRSGVGPPDAVATTVVKVLFRGVSLTG